MSPPLVKWPAMLQFPFVVEGKPHDGRLLKMVLKIQLKLLPFSNPSTQQILGEANNRLSNIELAQFALLWYLFDCAIKCFMYRARPCQWRKVNKLGLFLSILMRNIILTEEVRFNANLVNIACLRKGATKE